MPHIRVRGLDRNKLAEVSSSLVAEVSRVTMTPVSHFTLENVATEFFVEGRLVQGEPHCEILWFDRGQKVQDEVALLVTEQLKKVEPDKDVVVVFTVLDRARYYENGKHF